MGLASAAHIIAQVTELKGIRLAPWDKCWNAGRDNSRKAKEESNVVSQAERGPDSEDRLENTEKQHGLKLE